MADYEDSSEFKTVSVATSDESSEDEWYGYDKVIVSHNLAEEILDEIYGKSTYDATAALSGQSEKPQSPQLPTRSFAQEILEELYGRNYERLKLDDDEEEENSKPKKAQHQMRFIDWVGPPR